MKVECIEKPDRGYDYGDVTVGKIYETIIKDEDDNDPDYLLIGDDGNEWYYRAEYFKII